LLSSTEAKSFMRDIVEQRANRTGEPLSKATAYAVLTGLKCFLIWLAGQLGYVSRTSWGC
jgi:hypothetical protein